MTVRVHVNDRPALLAASQRTRTPQGFLESPAILARTGIQEYYAHEVPALLPLFGNDPTRIIRMLRPAEEVFKPASVASFQNSPITLTHPPDDVTAENWQQLAKGTVFGVKQEGQHLAGTIRVTATDAIKAIDDGSHEEISPGYAFEFDHTPGTLHGEAYDGVQRNIVNNHTALVPAGRCGGACRVGDALPTPTPTPTPTGAPTMADATRTVPVDGIPVQANDAAAGALSTLIAQRDEARTKVAAADRSLAETVVVEGKTVKVGDTAELKQAVAAADAKLTGTITLDGKTIKVGDTVEVAKHMTATDEKLKQLAKDAMSPEKLDALVADRFKTIGEVKRIVSTIVTDGKSCRTLRVEALKAVLAAADGAPKAVAGAVLAGRDLDKLDDDAVKGVFAATMAVVPAGASATDGIAQTPPTPAGGGATVGQVADFLGAGGAGGGAGGAPTSVTAADGEKPIVLGGRDHFVGNLTNPQAKQ